MAPVIWYRKIFWLLKREFPRWLVNWDYVWTAGKVILGEKFEFCLATDLCSILADETGISYNDHDFIELLSDYYGEPNEESIETVNKLYRLRLLIKTAEEESSFEAVSVALKTLIDKTEHIICKSFLINALVAHYERNELNEEAFNLLATIPHERRRSLAFLKKAYAPEYGVSEADYFYACLKFITHPVDRELAYEIEYVMLARSGRWEEAYQSFIIGLNVRDTIYDYQNFIWLLLNDGENVVIYKVLNLYLERLEKDKVNQHSDKTMKIFINELQVKGFGVYAEEITRIISQSNNEEHSRLN